MKVLINKNKSKRLITLSIVVVFLFQLILTSVVNINFSEDVHAEALSPKDTLLLKVLKAGFKKCIEGGVLSQNKIKDSDVKDGNLFNINMPIYVNDKSVLLPLKYGSGNTVKDGDISCKQLFTGYSDSNNSFNTFSALGGKNNIPSYGSVAEKNSFIEALGYTTEDRKDAQLYCAALNYTATEAVGTGNTRTTNSICVNVVDGKIKPSQGEKITSSDVVIKNTNSDEYISLSIDPSYKKFKVTMDLSKLTKDASSCQFTSTDIFTSENLDKYIGQTPQTFFSKFFDDIETKQILNKAISHGYYAGQIDSANCPSKPFPKELGVSSVVTNSTGSIDTGSKVNAVAGTELNNSIAKDYTYGGFPKSYDKLMKYYLPSYPVPSAGNTPGSLDYELYGGSSSATQTSGFTAVERAYNWYYVLHDVFNAISVDESVGCSTSRPSNGAYLQYLKQSESDPNKTEVQYCPMNESVLGLKANDILMDKSTNGKGVVNAADRISDTIKPQTAREILDNLNSINLASVCAADSSFPLCQATPIECKEDPNKKGCKELAGNNASEEEDGAKGEMSACFQNAGALGWMICPLMYTLRDAVQGIFNEFVEPLIRVDKSIVTNLAQNNDSSAMYKAWSLFRNMANIIFVIALLFVIFSQVTGFGIDSYGIKRLLPKLIVTAIIVNFSYFICGIVVDLSNLIGNSVRDIFENASRDLTFTAGKGSDGLGALGVATGVATGVAAAVTSVVALVTAGSALSAAASGGLLALILPVLGLAASAFMAGFFALLMLGARQAIIIIMIVTSPIAFVLYALPNTNALFKKWVSLFRGLLLLYPVYCFMVGGGFMAAKLIVKDSTGVFIQLIAGFISIAPYFAVPSMTRNALKGFDAAVNGIAKLQNRVNGGMQLANKKIMNSETVKASAGNYEFGKQAKFAKKYDGYTQEQLAQLSPGKRRRLMNALGVVGKDAQQAATIGAAMSQFKFNTSNEGKARAGAMAMTAEDENQVKAHQSDLIDKNMSYDEALKNLIDLQNEGYGENEEENHQRDLKMRAYQRHILSTKDGQKAYERYLKKGRYEDDSGNIIKSGSTSERSRAVLARDYMSNNSSLKDKYGVTYQQMQSMQGSGSVNTLRTSADGSTTIENARTNAVDKFVKTMDSKDVREISKYDAKEVDDAITGGKITQKTKDDFKVVVENAVRSLENDPTQVGELNDDAQNLITNVSGTNLNNLGNRVMEVRDNNGQLIQTMRWAKNSPVNGNGNGNGNGSGNGSGNGNGSGSGNGNGGPTP